MTPEGQLLLESQPSSSNKVEQRRREIPAPPAIKTFRDSRIGINKVVENPSLAPASLLFHRRKQEENGAGPPKQMGVRTGGNTKRES